METPRVAPGIRAAPGTIYEESIPSRDDLSNIQNAVKHIIDYLSFRNNTSDIDEKIGYLQSSINDINKEITSLRLSSVRSPRIALNFGSSGVRSPSGGSRKQSKTHKRAHRNKRRHTRARK